MAPCRYAPPRSTRGREPPRAITARWRVATRHANTRQTGTCRQMRTASRADRRHHCIVYHAIRWQCAPLKAQRAIMRITASSRWLFTHEGCLQLRITKKMDRNAQKRYIYISMRRHESLRRHAMKRDKATHTGAEYYLEYTKRRFIQSVCVLSHT